MSFFKRWNMQAADGMYPDLFYKIETLFSASLIIRLVQVYFIF